MAKQDLIKRIAGIGLALAGGLAGSLGFSGCSTEEEAQMARIFGTGLMTSPNSTPEQYQFGAMMNVAGETKLESTNAGKSGTTVNINNNGNNYINNGNNGQSLRKFTPEGYPIPPPGKRWETIYENGEPITIIYPENGPTSQPGKRWMIVYENGEPITIIYDSQ